MDIAAEGAQGLRLNSVRVKRRHFRLHVCETSIATGITILAGANGSGKTTLLSALSGHVKSQELDAMLGSAIFSTSKVSLMPQSPKLPRDLTPSEFLEQVSWLLGRDRRRARTDAHATIDMLDLGTYSRQRIATLSGGTQRRLAFGAALTNGAPVLLLDEPTNDLDPHQRNLLLKHIEAAAADRVIVVSSHALRDVASVASNIALLHDGRVLHSGPLAGFVQTFAPATLDPEDAYTACIERSERAG